MFRRSFMLIAYIACLVFCSSASGTTYYVAKNGSDLNPGSEDKPWKTIQKAADSLQPGDTTIVRQGVYLEEVRPMRSGSENNYITYRNYGTDQVTIDAEDKLRDACIMVADKDYLRFSGLTLRGAGEAGFLATDGSDHLILEGLTCQNNRFGIRLKGEVTPIIDSTIRDCIVTKNSSHGVFLYKRVYNSRVGPSNHIFANTGEKYAYGVEIGTDYPGLQSSGARDISIFNNEINGNGVQGLRTWNASNVLIKNNHCHHNGATGIQIENGSENVVVSENLCEYNALTYEYETGIWVDGTKNAVISGNSVRGNKIGLMITDSSRVIVRHNILIENNKGVPHLYNAMGLNVNRNAFDVIVVHNTFYRNGAPESTKGGISMCSKPPIGGVLLKNNILSETAAPYDLWIGCLGYASDYNTIFNTRNLVIEWKGSHLSWSQYLMATDQDSHSITTNPLFVAPESGDFHLMSGSPCIDRGSLLTKTANSGTGTVILVEDARYFTDGLGMTPGDLIKIGTSIPSRITGLDYVTNKISIDQVISWNKDDGVSYLHTGTSPDMGAYEGSEREAPQLPISIRVFH